MLSSGAGPNLAPTPPFILADQDINLKNYAPTDMTLEKLNAHRKRWRLYFPQQSEESRSDGKKELENDKAYWTSRPHEPGDEGVQAWQRALGWAGA